MVNGILNVVNKLKEVSLVNEINRISATRPESKDLMIENPTDLPLIFKDRRNAVFRIDDNRCIKYYLRPGKAENEFKNLQLGATHGISPKAYQYSQYYVVMEKIDTPTVAEFLTTNNMTEELARNLLQFIETLKGLGFRADQPPRYIFLMPNHTLKAVNLTYEPSDKPVFPRKLIKGMGKQVDNFLECVKKINPELHQEWSIHPQFTEIVEKARTREVKTGVIYK